MGTVTSILSILAAIGSILGWWREAKLRRDERARITLEGKAAVAELNAKVLQQQKQIDDQTAMLKQVMGMEYESVKDDPAAFTDWLNRKLSSL